MSSDTFTNRNRLIAGLVILSVISILIIYALIRLLPRESEPRNLGHRSPVALLTYCAPEQTTLCIVSFSQEVDGGMQVIFQAPRATYPLFTLMIHHTNGADTYECQRMEEISTGIVCTGAPQVPGEPLEFTIHSIISGTLLASGRLSIIGIALYTPEVLTTGTVEVPTGTPTETPTAMPLPRTPTPTRVTPTPFYPNPTTYPNPPYP